MTARGSATTAAADGPRRGSSRSPRRAALEALGPGARRRRPAASSCSPSTGGASWPRSRPAASRRSSRSWRVRAVSRPAAGPATSGGRAAAPARALRQRRAGRSWSGASVPARSPACSARRGATAGPDQRSARAGARLADGRRAAERAAARPSGARCRSTLLFDHPTTSPTRSPRLSSSAALTRIPPTRGRRPACRRCERTTLAALTEERPRRLLLELSSGAERATVMVQELSPLKRAILEIRDLRARLARPLSAPGPSRSRSSAWAAGSRRRRRPGGLLAAAAPTASTPSARCPPIAGSSTRSTIPTRPFRARCTRVTAASSTTSTGFEPAFFGISPREAARPWIRSSACCWRSPGRRSSTRAHRRRIGSPAARPASSSASATATTRRCSWPIQRRHVDAYFATGNAPASPPAASSYVLGPAGTQPSPSTPPARRRWWRCTWPARASAQRRVRRSRWPAASTSCWLPSRTISFSKCADAGARRPVQDVRRRRRRLRARARAAAWSC